MDKLEVLGLGAWSPRFASWDDLAAGLPDGPWQDRAALQPDQIPARERRRAPQLVKMAVEVMGQACAMAELDPDEVSTVFSSAMGDMQITDYLCTALAQTPKLVSPTRFHNSVHNAAPGYWSITTGSFSPATAVSAFEFTAPMALLEGAIEACEEQTAVLVVTQEVAAPAALLETCPSIEPCSAAILLAPPGASDNPLCELHISVLDDPQEWPQLPATLRDEFASNFGARLLPLFAALAGLDATGESTELAFPISPWSSIQVSVTAAA